MITYATYDEQQQQKKRYLPIKKKKLKRSNKTRRA